MWKPEAFASAILAVLFFIPMYSNTTNVKDNIFF